MNNTTLNEQIKKYRMSKKLTLAVLAERLGVTVSAVASYENGSRKPSFDVLIKIARIFNVTIDNLLGYTNKDLIDVSTLSLSQRNNVQALISTYKKFNMLLADKISLDKNEISSELEFYTNGDVDVIKDLLKKNNKNLRQKI